MGREGQFSPAISHGGGGGQDKYSKCDTIDARAEFQVLARPMYNRASDYSVTGEDE